jgi:hypothetical protein
MHSSVWLNRKECEHRQALGVDHEKLNWFHNGRDERATVNGGELITKALA